MSSRCSASKYGIDAYESVTQLCPNQLCHRQRQSFAGRIESLADDLEVVYGDLVLPKKIEAELPSVTDTWQDFNGAEHDDFGCVESHQPGAARVR